MWEEHLRAAEGDVAVAVGDGDDGRVPVAQQVHLRTAVRDDGVVDGQEMLLRAAVGLRDFHVGVEHAGSPTLDVAHLELRVEVVDPDRERLEIVGVHRAAGGEVVVLRDRIGESAPLHDYHASPEPAEARPGQRDEDADERNVEHQVAEFAQVATLGAEPLLTASKAIPLRLEPALRPFHRAIVELRHQLVLRESVETFRKGGRGFAEVSDVLRDARQDAADQRNEQEEVDRGEPRRAVHVVHARLLEESTDLGILGLVIHHLDRRNGLLWEHRPRDRRKGKEEEEDEHGAHARQLRPNPSDRRHQRIVPKLAAH